MPEPRVRNTTLVSENGLFLTSGARNENRRPLLRKNIPQISWKYDLRNHFWPLESVFFIRKSEKKGHNFFGRFLNLRIRNPHIKYGHLDTTEFYTFFI